MKTKVLIKSLLIAVCFVGLCSNFALAKKTDLLRAKQNGYVCERLDGFVQAVDTPPDKVLKLIDHVNMKRLQKYKDIAEKDQINLEVVKVAAGQKQINKALPDTYIMNSSGQCVKKQ